MRLPLIMAVLLATVPAFAREVLDCPRDSWGDLPTYLFEKDGHEEQAGPPSWSVRKGIGINGDFFHGQAITVVCRYPDGKRLERALNPRECHYSERGWGLRISCR